MQGVDSPGVDNSPKGGKGVIATSACRGDGCGGVMGRGGNEPNTLGTVALLSAVAEALCTSLVLSGLDASGTGLFGTGLSQLLAGANIFSGGMSWCGLQRSLSSTGGWDQAEPSTGSKHSKTLFSWP